MIELASPTFVIKYAQTQIDRADGDLDCAGWALQQVVNRDPENAEASGLLDEVILRINRAFDSDNQLPICCHIALGYESPSPYVRAMEASATRDRELQRGCLKSYRVRSL